MIACSKQDMAACHLFVVTFPTRWGILAGRHHNYHDSKVRSVTVTVLSIIVLCYSFVSVIVISIFIEKGEGRGEGEGEGGTEGDCRHLPCLALPCQRGGLQDNLLKCDSKNAPPSLHIDMELNL